MTRTIRTAKLRARALRWIALGAASVLLHVLLFDWLAARIAGFAFPQPVLKVTIAASQPGSAAETVAPAAPAQAEAPPHEAPAAASAPAPGGAAAADPAAAAPLHAGAENRDEAVYVTSRFRVADIPSADLEYAVTFERGGVVTARGSATLSWRHGASDYQLRIENRFDGELAARHPRARSGDGNMNEAGVAPENALETSPAGAELRIRFDRADGLIRFSHSTLELPNPSGTQEAATVPLQLAGIGKADPGQFDNRVSMYVAGPAGITIASFELVGQQQLDTPLGTAGSWHLAQLPGPNQERLELWLAPEYDWLALKMRSTAPDGAVTTWEATSLARPGATQ